MHKDIDVRVRKVAEQMRVSVSDAQDALTVLGLLLFYNQEAGQVTKARDSRTVFNEAMDRARRGNLADEIPAWLSGPEGDAIALARQIERETGSE